MPTCYKIDQGTPFVLLERSLTASLLGNAVIFRKAKNHPEFFLIKSKDETK